MIAQETREKTRRTSRTVRATHPAWAMRPAAPPWNADEDWEGTWARRVARVKDTSLSCARD
jgi:hypothetical protein